MNYLKRIFANNSKKLPDSEEFVDKRPDSYPDWVAYEPKLIPPLKLMGTEGIVNIEEWFRWAEEWSLILRYFGKTKRESDIMEIGCGLGRVAFPLRYILTSEGSYSGFEICKEKIDFLQGSFQQTYPNFKFTWANVHNTYYNPTGTEQADSYVFPYTDNSFDVVFAASVFTHMLPAAARNYFKQTARVLKPNGRVVFSMFVLDNYDANRERPLGFGRAGFNFDHQFENFGEAFAISNPVNPEEMTAYKMNFINELAKDAGLVIADSLTGFWSGTTDNWISSQDLLIFEKA